MWLNYNSEQEIQNKHQFGTRKLSRAKNISPRILDLGEDLIVTQCFSAEILFTQNLHRIHTSRISIDVTFLHNFHNPNTQRRMQIQGKQTLWRL